MKATVEKHTLFFKHPAGTSRGTLLQKETYLLKIKQGYKVGIGECALFRGLSCDDVSDYEQKLQWLCENIHLGERVLKAILKKYPSIVFGLEQAFLSLKAGSEKLFHNDFTEKGHGIFINGLIWMGSIDAMKKQVHQKINAGFTTIKIKIGALDFEKEYLFLQEIRKYFPPEKITLRLDANGAFSPDEAVEKLTRLAHFSIHSIEQPIAPKYIAEMAVLCAKNIIPIALDESLIGVLTAEKQKALLEKIHPQYIILKPSLTGGFVASQKWIDLAKKMSIGYWITSALESNIGLNAIAQWTAGLCEKLPQGLGTGSLFTANFPSRLHIKKGRLFYR